jgi:hypothetical protein
MLNPYDIYITPEEYKLAASHGVPATMLDRRVRQQDWPKHKAMTTPPRRSKPRGYFTEWLRLAKQNGIGRDAFFSRLSRGWSEDVAATTPIESEDEIREHALMATEHVRVFPEKYLRLAEQNGIPYATFRYRVKHCGWDYERAATEPKWTREQMGKLGAQRLREREGDWAAQIFGTR